MRAQRQSYSDFAKLVGKCLDYKDHTSLLVKTDKYPSRMFRFVMECSEQERQALVPVIIHKLAPIVVGMANQGGDLRLMKQTGMVIQYLNSLVKLSPFEHLSPELAKTLKAIRGFVVKAYANGIKPEFGINTAESKKLQDFYELFVLQFNPLLAPTGAWAGL